MREFAGVDLPGTAVVVDAGRRAKFRTPLARLAPPVSNARLSAAGLVSKKLVGASASIISPVSRRAFVSWIRSSLAAVTSWSTNSANAWWYIRSE